jgi:hypothetical protein
MNGEHEYSWQKYEDKMEQFVEANHKQLLTPFEIHKRYGIGVKDLEILFKMKNVELYKQKEIAKRKREKHFDLLYQFHFVDKLSLNEIYRKYGYSPQYVKKVFEDRGMEHLGMVN